MQNAVECLKTFIVAQNTELEKNFTGQKSKARIDGYAKAAAGIGKN